MKLRKLHIENYKMFKDFDISFVDENDEPLPIVVLAGVNGSGKTTLLEWIFNEYYKVLQKEEKGNGRRPFVGRYGINKNLDDKYIENDYLINKYFLYIPSGLNDIQQISDEFVKTFYFFLKEKDYRSSEITEQFHKYMKNIFDDLDIGFKYSHLDKDDNVWFSNGENKEYYYTAKRNDNEDKNIFTIDELSTGEKTLLSKIMYLYFKDYKDKVILIDEPELSLHPSWQNKVLKIYENFAIKNNCQIIIATHSPHIIGSAKAEYVRVLKKVDNKIEVYKYTKSYGLEFNKILVDIMEADTRVSDVSERLSKIKSLIIQNDFDSDEFKEIWSDLERLIGADNIDLRLLKLEIASRRKKNVSNR